MGLIGDAHRFNYLAGLVGGLTGAWAGERSIDWMDMSMSVSVRVRVCVYHFLYCFTRIIYHILHGASLARASGLIERSTRV